MGLRINSNIEAVAAHRHAAVASNRVATALQRLSSGLRINSAADDAAGLGISEHLRGQIRSLEQANRNIQDGISLLQTAEAALQEVSSILQRARELQVQFNNGTNGVDAQLSIILEMIQLSNEVDRIEGTAMFNDIQLLSSATTPITLQVGINANETISFSLYDLFGMGMSLVRPVTFFTAPGGTANIPQMDDHISDVATARGRLGAIQNRLEHALAANQAKQEAYMATESRIRDADMASEMSEYTRQSILQRSSMAMLAQAQNPKSERIKDLIP